MNQIKNESDLESILKKDVLESEKDSIKIIAGHAPMVYEDRTVSIDTDRWGEFSDYTFELGAKLLQYAKTIGKDAKLVVIIDDLVELPLIDEISYKRLSIDRTMKRGRRRIYETNIFPESYIQLINEYGLIKSDFVYQKRTLKNSHKQAIGKIDASLISEQLLKEDAKSRGLISENECALAVNALISNKEMFDLSNDYLIGLIPGQCKGNVCRGVLDTRDDLDSSMIFFPHIEVMGGLLRVDDVTRRAYAKIGESISIPEIFDSGVLYRKTLAK
ncbi:MAG: hypothetical protein ACP5NV_05090 [Candidatus Woesearchaeota archaeon]